MRMYRSGNIERSINYFQKFQIKGKEFIKYQHKFLERLDKYYSGKNQAKTYNSHN